MGGRTRALFIDGPILMYTTALAIYRARHDTATVVRRTRRRLWAFTFASVLLNAAHASAFWQWDYTRMEAWFGTLVAALAPLAALLSAEDSCTSRSPTPPSARRTSNRIPRPPQTIGRRRETRTRVTA